MSTNYYFRNKEEYANYENANNIVNQKIEEIIEAIEKIVNDEDEINIVKTRLHNAAYVRYETIHIGKLSINWKPTFERQDGLYSSFKELKQFYEDNKDKYDLVSDYGNIYSWDEFKKIIDDWQGTREDKYNVYKDEEGYIWAMYEFD